MGRPARLGLALLALAALVPVGAPGQDQDVLPPAPPLELDRTQPDHMRPPERFEPAPQPTPWPPRGRPRPWIIYRLPEPVGEVLGERDEDLSRLCRSSLFRQVEDGRYRAAVPDGWLGVAFSNGLNLHDPSLIRSRFEEPMVFLFQRQDTTRCQVWVGTVELMLDYYAPDQRPRR